MRKNLSCISPIETAYYSAGYEEICYHCGSVDNINNASSDNYYPICQRCLSNKKAKVNRRGKKKKAGQEKEKTVSNQ